MLLAAERRALKGSAARIIKRASAEAAARLQASTLEGRYAIERTAAQQASLERLTSGMRCASPLQSVTRMLQKRSALEVYFSPPPVA